MKEKVIGILIVGIIIVTVFPCVNGTINKIDEKKDTVIYESRIFGVGFVRINGLTHVIKGFVLFGISNGEVISMEFINIKYTEADPVLAGYISPLIFIIRYNPA